MKEESYDFNRVAARRLSEAEQQYIQLRLEKARLNRERANNILNKGLALYAIFTVVALFAIYNNMVTSTITNTLVIASLCVLVVAVTPYLRMTAKEEKAIDAMLESLMGDK